MLTAAAANRKEQKTTTGLIAGLFVHKDAISRHLSAPMVQEREGYLSQLLEAGHTKEFVAAKASALLHVIQPLNPISETEGEEDIADPATMLLVELQHPSLAQNRSRGKDLLAVSRSWTRYIESLHPRKPPLSHFQNCLGEFVKAMRDDLGYLPSSIRSCTSPIKKFMNWVSLRHQNLSSVSLVDIDCFITERIAEGRSQRTIVGECRALRCFFRYAERRGWSAKTLSKTIKAPFRNKRREPLQSPTWKQVRSTIASLDSSNPSHCRAKAVLLLASVYGFRRSEICRLTLEDLDWMNEILTIRRSKRGRVQQFPIQYEVGEALIRYLREVRTPSRFRNVFLTLHSPYRPAANIGSAMRKIMSAQNTLDRSWGLHALRHACATELLRKGASLQGIAEFLGHRSVHSVSVYAHCDNRTFRRVAEVDLKGLLCD